ncbi:MAG: hypothetical protein ACRDOH_15985, partial [Streptosporangiaceae bacterium]
MPALTAEGGRSYRIHFRHDRMLVPAKPANLHLLFELVAIMGAAARHFTPRKLQPAPSAAHGCGSLHTLMC